MITLTLNNHQVLYKQIIILRSISLICSLCLWAFLTESLALKLPHRLFSILSLLYGCSCILSVWRLKLTWQVTSIEVFLQLLCDGLVLFIVLWSCGRSANPLIAYYLVLLAICAAAFPFRYALSYLGFAISAHSLLLWLDISTPNSPHSHDLVLHIIGMWLSFIFSAFLIVGFTAWFSKVLKQRDQLLNQIRETAMRNEQIIALGALAASTAHNLATPLATMTIVLDELEQSMQQSEIHLLKQQVARCRNVLQQLTQVAERNQKNKRPILLSELLVKLKQQIAITLPQHNITISVQHSGLDELVLIDNPNLEQALFHLLENAVQMAKKQIHIIITTHGQQLLWTIEDDGPGIPKSVIQSLGAPFTETNSGGLGLGLFLAFHTVRRLGGNLVLSQRKPNGARQSISLDLSQVMA